MLKKWFSIVTIILALVMVAITQLPSRAYAQTQGQCWALIVGVSEYQDASITDLPSVGNENFYRHLADYWGEDHVQFLLGEQASKYNIKTQIQGWLDSHENAGDTVLVSFAGHGADGIFAPYDASGWSTGSCISDTELNSWLSCLESEKQIVILDSCFSGSFIHSLTRNGRVILTSSAASEYSYYDFMEGNIFLYCITGGFDKLETVDSDGNGEVSAEEFFQYARPQTITMVNSSWQSQHPQIDDNLPDEADLLAKLTVTSEYGQAEGEGWYGLYRPAQISVSSNTITTDVGTRELFTGWQTSGGWQDTSQQTSIIMESAEAVAATWQKQYSLTVSSSYGKPTWTEWNNASAEASLSVNPIEDHQDGSREIFAGWTGSSGIIESSSPQTGIIMDSPKTVSASWKRQYFLNVEGGPADPTPLNIQGWYDVDTVFTTGTAEAIEPGGPGTRYVFINWIVNGAETSGNTLELKIDSPKEVAAKYETEYYLTVQSAYGKPSEGGWYAAGSAAPVSVTRSEGLLIRHIFTGWKGSISGGTPDITITMDGPKTFTADFRTDYSRLIILISVVLAVLILAAVLIWRKVRAGHSVPVMPAVKQATPVPVAVPLAPEMPAVRPAAPAATVPRGRLILPDNSEIPLTEAVSYIGREHLLKVTLPDTLKFISRQHFLIRHEAGRYFIEDLKSANGTKVGGVEIGGKGLCELRDGDRIEVASLVLLTFRTGFPI